MSSLLFTRQLVVVLTLSLLAVSSTTRAQDGSGSDDLDRDLLSVSVFGANTSLDLLLQNYGPAFDEYEKTGDMGRAQEVASIREKIIDRVFGFETHYNKPLKELTYKEYQAAIEDYRVQMTHVVDWAKRRTDSGNHLLLSVEEAYEARGYVREFLSSNAERLEYTTAMSRAGYFLGLTAFAFAAAKIVKQPWTAPATIAKMGTKTRIFRELGTLAVKETKDALSIVRKVAPSVAIGSGMAIAGKVGSSLSQSRVIPQVIPPPATFWGREYDLLSTLQLEAQDRDSEENVRLFTGFVASGLGAAALFRIATRAISVGIRTVGTTAGVAGAPETGGGSFAITAGLFALAGGLEVAVNSKAEDMQFEKRRGILLGKLYAAIKNFEEALADRNRLKERGASQSEMATAEIKLRDQAFLLGFIGFSVDAIYNYEIGKARNDAMKKLDQARKELGESNPLLNQVAKRLDYEFVEESRPLYQSRFGNADDWVKMHDARVTLISLRVDPRLKSGKNALDDLLLRSGSYPEGIRIYAEFRKYLANNPELQLRDINDPEKGPEVFQDFLTQWEQDDQDRFVADLKLQAEVQNTLLGPVASRESVKAQPIQKIPADRLMLQIATMISRAKIRELDVMVVAPLVEQVRIYSLLGKSIWGKV